MPHRKQPSEEYFDESELKDQPGDQEMVGTAEGEVPEGAAATTAHYVVPAGEVVYRGSYSAREITKADWQKAGVSDQQGVRWDRANNFSLAKDGFSEAALRVLAHDRDIRVGE